MYSLNDDLQDARSGRSIDYFKQGVSVHLMNLKGDAKIALRILPAYDPATIRMNPTTQACEPTDPKSWVPFRDPKTGQVQTWARKIMVSAYVGHGKGQQSRRSNILAMETFKEQSQGQIFCPVRALIDYIQGNREWGYLMEDTKSPDGKQVLESKALGYPGVLMLANIVVPNTSPKVELGVFKQSAYKSMFNKDKPPYGLVYQEAIITDPAILQQNPMARWLYGDITDPNKGFVLEMSRDSSQYGEYHIGIYTHNGLAYPYPIGDALLAQRYNLLDLNCLVRRPSDDETISQLVKALNGINPQTREHEWALLHRVFDSIAGRGVIPPPPAQGYVQGYSMPPPQAPAQGMGQLPGLPMPGSSQPPPFPLPAPDSTGQPPPQGNVTVSMQAQQSPFPGGTPVAQQPTPRPADTPAFVPSAGAPAGAPQPGSGGQPLPGDQPSQQDREKFLAQLQGAFGGRPTG